MIIDWYFDVISPFSYLQFALLQKRRAELPAGTTLRYKPLLFAGLLDHWDNKGPAEIAPKRVWTFEHCAWTAHRHGIPFTVPAHHPFNPLPLLRLCVALGTTEEAVGRVFGYVWREGHLPTDAAPWAALLAECGAAADRRDSDAVKQVLRAHGEEAAARGIFGVPAAAIGPRNFWGVDATDMLLAWLHDDAFFTSDGFRAAGALPEGVQRKPKPAA